jgi:hypothetical protein
MRILITATLDTDKANAAMKAGTFDATIGQILEDADPEAAYFGVKDGRHTAYLVVEMSEPSQLLAIAEPFFYAFGASISDAVVMVADDLQKAGPSIGAAAEKYG